MLKIKYLLIVAQLLCFSSSLFSQKQKVWLDTDTGNETDDVYAIVQLLMDNTIDLVGISSAHFNNPDLVAFQKWNQYPTKGINTVNISQQLNEEILALMEKSYIPHPIGADRQMGRAWGSQEPRNSEATKQIIRKVKELKPNEKLHVISIGALTNVASAIALDTSIASHIQCYLLGAKYNLEKKYWDKSEFNIRNDLNAFDYLLNNPKVELIIMPTSTALPFRFERDDLYAVLNDKNPVLKHLKQRWEETNPESTTRTLWDVALILAYQKPAFITIQEVLTPPENTQRLVKVYAQMDVNKMKQFYWNSLKSLKKNQ
ncbi:MULTISPECIES: nucleoside hydrolase [unclassified Arcicella]|uniref:nucleoside hydrolase n=1 Tax=unclassified Arcicella TaxID=2644986 RepID=UPI002863E1E2|nr:MULTISPECIES: nucleoside hydrolase [unclassified Arcicella]MDR6562308.1 inosine-uridine nucleoside N-ribohydrolase [Arcicella sp. BE51]MDR6811997.1 inosine-uridine nucleoside N-ribohydrolase [Arcicella sp. BE140]MDR6823308.1 inosine-uridine nucleoside N-ribohydrolase [Arcicella sp. BE139]